ncbi:MAG: hypothetical protein ACE5LS_07605 [Thermoplasmata archaeon]
MTYEEVKEFHGRKYTGMAVGGRHTWIYPNALWRERKVTPDQWEFSLSSIKEREIAAPVGSGAPPNTQYRWYILAHQRVRKIDSNTYSTCMTGVKYKLAHKRADRDRWNTEYGRGPSERERLVSILEAALAKLRGEGLPKRIASLADFWLFPSL